MFRPKLDGAFQVHGDARRSLSSVARLRYLVLKCVRPRRPTLS